MHSLLQTKSWADFRETQGWSYDNIDGIFILHRPLFLDKTFLYTPEVSFSDIRNFDNFLTNVEKIAKNNHALFFRLEILDEKTAENEPITAELKQHHFIKAFEEVQPEYRQVIDISKPEEEILAQMKEKGRYNTKIAERKGVQIQTSTDIDTFYKLFIDTAKRSGFKIRPKNYFQTLLDVLSSVGYGELLVAKFQGETIAVEIVTYFDQTASYLYGASSNEFREVMAPYLLHLEAMRRAKERGCKYYDLLAVAPVGEEKHKYAGISRFKRQFGGLTVQNIGSYDLVFQPTWYKLFKFAEKVRRH